MRAELADGRVLEFPDGTDPAVVQDAVKKVLAGDAGVGQPSPQQSPVPRKAALFAEMQKRGLVPGQSIDTRAISSGSPFRESTVDTSQMSPREAAMAELAADTGFLETIGASVGKGLMTVGRGLGLVEPAGDIEKEAFAALGEESPIATTVGETIGEAAPFVPLAVATGGISALAPRALATGAVTALEGGAIASGRDQDVFKAAGIGGGIGLGAEILFPVLGKLGSKVFQRVTGKAPKGAMIDATGNPTQELQQALDAAGMTFGDLTEDAVVSLGVASGKYDPVQAARKEYLESQGLTPTKAQVTAFTTFPDGEAESPAACLTASSNLVVKCAS